MDTRLTCIIIVVFTTVEYTRNNIDDSKAAALDDRDERLVAVLWQHICAITLLNEVDVLD